jgi:squalene-hopene/tetraprenyl-beta-curcumene cyclase
MLMKQIIRFSGAVAILVSAGLLTPGISLGAQAPESQVTTNTPVSEAQQELSKQAQSLIDSGLKFLQSQQKPDGSWQRASDPPGVTAIALRAFVSDPSKQFTSRTPFVKKGYEKLFSYQLANGGIYQDLLANYNTAIAVSAIAAAHDPSFKGHLDKAVAFLKGLQWTESSTGPKGEKVDKSNPWYGGWGYGHHARPDLSNAQFAIEALHDAGLKSDDPAFKNALIFLNRTQNNSETNDQSWSGDDGGFIYSPANGGQSEAGFITTPDGRKVPRSYGTMTYAGLKSMIYAGVGKDDPRVKSAMNWIKQHWTLSENPAMREGSADMAQNGLYYYFYVFAHALNAYDDPTISDSRDVSHDWRKELVDKVASLQHADGSWVGEKRWMEDNPILTTSYVVLALEEVQKDLRQHPLKAPAR